VYSGLQNSIETLLTPTSTGCTLLFPNSFEGAVRIIFITSVLATVAGATLTPGLIVPSGNFLSIYDMYDANGDPTYICQSPSLAVGATVAPTNNVTVENHFYVTPAAEGTNNYITFSSTSACTSAVKTYVEVSQYNSMGLTEPAASGQGHTAPMNFTNNSSGATVGGANL
jgi:hypothetical protein